MSRLLDRLQDLFAAVAFAEEGDAETALRLAAGDGAPDRGPRPRPAAPTPSAEPPRTVPFPRRQGA